ncbi:aldo/keto reductase [Phormidium tenue FACHB-886]|nr:aldo/keto reductase [Phormidium tenue FACHB-886]
MDKIQLGANETAIAPLGIGTWAWGDNLFWDYGKTYDAPDLQRAFKTALECGVTFFDTAEIYGFGESERLLGQFRQQVNEPIQIATKYFPLPWRFTAAAVEEALTASLKRLQLPSVALYQVHQPFAFLMGQKSLMNALADEVQQGRIKAVGISNYSAEQMREAHKLLSDRGIPLAVNQVQYSLFARQIERNGILDTARELGITILAYSPLAQGLLTGKYTPETTHPTGARRLDPRFSQKGLEKLAPAIATLKEIGENYGKTPAQVALNWLIAQGNVIPIPGAKNAEQVQMNAGALNWSMTEAERERIDRVTQEWL